MLFRSFRPDTHPGTYTPAHEPNREAVYFYYAASVSKALRTAKVTEAGGKPWAPALAAATAMASGTWPRSRSGDGDGISGFESYLIRAAHP